jgi:hypothetical protein
MMTPASARYADHDRLSVFTGSLLLTLAFMRFLVAPARPIVRANVFGSPLGLNLSVNDLMLLIILGLSVTAIASLLHAHPLAQEGEIEHPYMYWIVPALLNLALAAWLMRITNLGTWVVILLACGGLIPFTLSVECQAVSEKHRRTRWLQSCQTTLIQLTALIVLTLIYEARIRSLLSATAVSLVAILLAGRLFWITASQIPRAFRYAGIVGLIMGQVTWGLNYWRLSSIQGGLILWLVFYVVVGLVQQFLQGQLDDGRSGRRILLEYGGVAIVTLLLITLIASS